MALTLVFDLDGTLVDTAPDLIRACDQALATKGLGPAPSALIRPQISFGSRAMIVAALGHHGVALPQTEIDGMWAEFLAHYEANVAVASRPFDGIAGVLERAVARGDRLAVCTNKVERLSRLLLDTLGLSRHFAAIAGRDTFSVMKPHPDHLLGAIAQAGGDPAHAVMIGDSGVDIATARAAGVPVIAVTFGYSPAAVATYAPDAVIDTYAEFDLALARVLAAR